MRAMACGTAPPREITPLLGRGEPDVQVHRVQDRAALVSMRDDPDVRDGLRDKALSLGSYRIRSRLRVRAVMSTTALELVRMAALDQVDGRIAEWFSREIVDHADVQADLGWAKDVAHVAAASAAERAQ